MVFFFVVASFFLSMFFIIDKYFLYDYYLFTELDDHGTFRSVGHFCFCFFFLLLFQFWNAIGRRFDMFWLWNLYLFSFLFDLGMDMVACLCKNDIQYVMWTILFFQLKMIFSFAFENDFDKRYFTWIIYRKVIRVLSSDCVSFTKMNCKLIIYKISDIDRNWFFSFIYFRNEWFYDLLNQ